MAVDDKPFRVLLDLTDLYLENFKYVWINVSPRELRTISDFKTALLHKINLEREDIKLFVRDGLLLERETVNVLREDDTVKVQYEVHAESNSVNNYGEKSRKSSRKRNYSEGNIGEIHSKEKRHKIDSEISNQSSASNSEITNEKKKRKEKPPNSVSVEVNKAVDYVEALQSKQKKEKYQKKKDKNNSAFIENSSIKEDDLSQQNDTFFSFAITDDTMKQNKNNTCLVAANVSQDNLMFDSTKDSSKTNDDDTYEQGIGNDTSVSFKADVKKTDASNNCPKKKRKRHKKRKHTNPIHNDALNNSNISNKFVSLSESINVEAKPKHVTFSPVSYEKYSAVICDESSRVPSSSSATFAVINNQLFKDYPKISTPTQSDGCCKPSWHVSMMQSRNSAYRNEHKTCKEEPPKESTSGVKNTIQDSKGSQFLSEIQYEDLPALNSVPKIGTHFVYKTLELDESYSPTISNYRQGIVKSINPDTEEIEIELSKHMIKPGRTGKFENLKEDEIPTPEVKKYDILRWSAIISPKQLS